MVYIKKGIPEEGDVVLCDVKKILPHSVFVGLVEYGGREAMIHISEIAPGRIRNIRDFVKEGKQVACKVLQLNRDRGTIDLSLRRVSLQQRLKKEEEFKQEQKSEKILEYVAQKMKTNLQDLYEKAGSKIIEEYGSLTACFHDAAKEGIDVLKQVGIPENYAKELFDAVKERIKPPEVHAVAELTLESNGESGVEDVRKALKIGEGLIKDNNYKGSITYISAPKYRLELVFHDYKTADEGLLKVANAVVAEMKKLGGVGAFKKEEKK